MPSKKQKPDSRESKLIIVESPTKAKTISRFLGAPYEVQASFGHVRDLPKSKLGIDVEHDFTPTYTIPSKAKEVIADLRQKADNATEVILATDEDREGEAISWHLVEALKLKNKDSIKRIVFHEITKPAIQKALDNPRSIDMHLVDAQQARRVLDRLVGYELSPFLWKKIRYGLSAGRVQSVAVRLVVEREREIEKFKTEEYWSIEAEFTKKTGKKEIIKARLQAIQGKSVGKMEIANEQQARDLVEKTKNANYTIEAITVKETNRTPAPPFTTSTLQQEASRKFGFSAKQTMVIAQQLYEGVDLGESTRQGLITYMRTDSVNLSTTAITDIRSVIEQDFGKSYQLETPRAYTTKSKGAQEAHEAIRPTESLRRPQDLVQFLDRNQMKLYGLIWKRTVACQMQQAKVEQTTVDIASDTKEVYTFRANGQVIKFDGFMRAYTEGTDEKTENENDDETTLPELSKGEALDIKTITPNQHFTTPPGRYTDATLIKALEAEGVGRPSTYAPTLSTIQTREYVEKKEKKYHPTEIGTLVNDLLVEHFPEIVDVGFTSKIEEELDGIAEGTLEWTRVCREFYQPFKKHLIEKEATVEKQETVSETPCPHCGKPMIEKFGRMGKFLSCPDPESKVTLPMPEEAAKIKELEEKTKDEKCPICSLPMIVKRGRFGFFLGCSNYPTCRGIAKIWNKTGFKCPNCKTGDVVEKKSRGRGKPFYACTRYPECTFVMNKKPESIEDLNQALVIWNENKDKPEKQAKKKTLKTEQ